MLAWSQMNNDLTKCYAQCDINHQTSRNNTKCKEKCLSKFSPTGSYRAVKAQQENISDCKTACAVKHQTSTNRGRCEDRCYERNGGDLNEARNSRRCNDDCKQSCAKKHDKASNRRGCESRCLDKCL